MASIGETLRRERQKRDLELDQVSDELKIAPRFLKAIEEERFDRLPGGVFAKSFVRQYARMLDLDEEEAAAEVQRVLAPAPIYPPFGQVTPVEHPPAAHAGFLPHVDAIAATPRRRFGKSSWLSALILVVVVMLGCSLFYGWWRDRRAAAVLKAAAPVHKNTPAKTQPPAQAPAQTSASIAGTPQASAPAPTNPAPVQTAPSPDAQPLTESATALQPSGPVSVELITSDEPVWILARTDGKFAFSGTLEPNQTRTLQADGNVVLRLGNAGGVTVMLNGKPLGALGPKGQVRTVQLTSGGFQIVPPKPSTPPAAPI